MLPILFTSTKIAHPKSLCSTAFPGYSGHWGLAEGGGGQGASNELRPRITPPSWGAPKRNSRESRQEWGESHRRATNKGQDQRVAEFPRGSEFLKGQATCLASWVYSLSAPPGHSWDIIKDAGQFFRDQDLRRSQKGRICVPRMCPLTKD